MNELNHITHLTHRRTRLITAENVYGEIGRGGMAEQSETPQESIVRIGQRWDVPNKCARDLGQKWKIRPAINLDPQSTTKIMDVNGPAAITHIWITTDPKYYRDIILRFYWDNEATPSIEVPLGDFFCCGWKQRLNILSIPVNVNPQGGMNMYFPMPFRRHACITVENRAPVQIEGFFYAISFEEREVAEDEAYFHAGFNRSNPLEYGQDFVILDDIQGHGHFVGTQISWQQNNDGWWGEGEIKAFIDDDDEFPTYCGTGTEDYFGGAWGFLENFTAPYLGYQDLSAAAGRPTNTIGNRHSMYRFHIMDPIRFEKRLRVTIQAIGWRSEGRFLPLQDDISSVAYWYQSEPHTSLPVLGSRDALEII